MIKKFLLLLCCLTLVAGSFTACEMKKRIEPPMDTSSTADPEEDEPQDTPSDEKTYTVALRAEGGTIEVSSVEVTYNENYTLPTPTRVGYTFIGWKDETGTAYATTGVWTQESGVTLIAQWTTSTYTLTLDANGGKFADNATSKEMTVTYGVAIGAMETPTRENYTFVSWKKDGVTVQSTDIWNYVANTTFQAEWREEQTEYVTVTFVQSGFDDVVKQVVKGADLPTTEIPDVNQVIGYDVAWESATYTNIQSNMTVEAVLTPKTYTISFDEDGGSELTDQTVTYKQAYTLAKPTKKGYTFAGWSHNGQSISSGGDGVTIWEIADDVTLKALWAANQYTVKLTVTSGAFADSSTTKDIVVTYGEAYDFSTEKPKHNNAGDYSFNKWVLKGTDTKVVTSGIWELVPTSGTTIELEAKWSSNWTGFY